MEDETAFGWQKMWCGFLMSSAHGPGDAGRQRGAVEDGFVVNYFAMDFAGKTASVEVQRWAMQALAGTWNDYEGHFPERG